MYAVRTALILNECIRYSSETIAPSDDDYGIMIVTPKKLLH